MMEKQTKGRYWITAIKKNGTLLASGHDEGIEIFQLNKERIPHALISKNLVIFAQGMTSYLYDVVNKKENMELYQYKPKDKNANVFIDKIISNPFEESAFMVQINELGESNYMIKKKENYLSFPTVCKDYAALDSCFASKTHTVSVVTPLQIKIENYLDKKETARTINFKEPTCVRRVFHSNTPNQFIFVTSNNNLLTKYDTNQKAVLAYVEVEDSDVRGIVHGAGKMAIMTKMGILITSQDLQKVTSIKEKFPVKSAFWESDRLLFYTTTNHLKYAFMNGETGVLQTLEQPLHLLLKQKGNKFLAFNETKKIFEIEFPDYKEIELKMALNDHNFEKVKAILATMSDSKKKIIIKYLVEKGYAELGLDLVDDPENKFSLAIQSSNFELAHKLCCKINTQEYWKMLGEEGLRQGIYEAYEFSCQMLKNFDNLNFLYSLQANNEKLKKMGRVAKKSNNFALAFNAHLFLNNSEGLEEVLRDVGLSKLAELSHEAQDPTNLGPLLQKLKSRPLAPCEPVGEDNSANWPHVVEEEDD